MRNNKIVHSKARCLGPNRFVALKTEINRLLEADIIQPNHSEFSSPIALVTSEVGFFQMRAISQISTRSRKQTSTHFQMYKILSI